LLATTEQTKRLRVVGAFSERKGRGELKQFNTLFFLPSISSILPHQVTKHHNHHTLAISINVRTSSIKSGFGDLLLRLRNPV